MIAMDIGKVRSIFDGLAIEMEAVVTEHAQFDRDLSQLRIELALMKDRHAVQLLKARRTIRQLRKDAKARGKKR